MSTLRIAEGVLCAGNIVNDVVVRPVGPISYGHTQWVDAIEQHLGGNGANTSLALGRLGVPVRLLGQIGSDAFADGLLARLRQAGVDTAGVDHSALPTASTVVLVREDGARAFLHRPGASQDALASPIDFAAEGSGWSHFHVGNAFALPTFRPLVAQNLLLAKASGLSTSMDTGWDARGEWMSVLQPALGHTDLLFVNEPEAERLTGHAEPERAAQALRAHGVGLVVLKQGAAGCMLFGESAVRVPGFAVTAVDTTGAGDCFTAGFLAALHRGRTLEEAARFANAVGALSVQHVGATTGVRSYDETLAWMGSGAGP